jgi:GNAT superfamily N-acetyltransferase
MNPGRRDRARPDPPAASTVAPRDGQDDLVPMASLVQSDLAQIAQVWHEALASSTDHVPTTTALRMRLSGDLAACDVAVVRDGRCIVAFVACDREQRWLRQLFVHPAHQGTGIGTRLLKRAMQAMPGGWLRTDAINQRARDFYERRGLHVLRAGLHPVSGAPTIEFGWP